MPYNILSETAHRFLQIFAFFGQNGDRYRLPEAHSAKNGDRYRLPEAHSAKNGDRYRLPEANSTKNGDRYRLPEAHSAKNGDRYRLPEAHSAKNGDRYRLPEASVTHFLLIRGLGRAVFLVFRSSEALDKLFSPFSAHPRPRMSCFSRFLQI